MFLNQQPPKTRVNGTTKSSIPFETPGDSQKYDFPSQGVR